MNDEIKQNRFTAECMLIAFILRLGTSGIPDKPFTKDDEGRLQLCLKVLSDKTSMLSSVFNTECRDALGQMLEATVTIDTTAELDKKVVAIQPHCPILIRACLEHRHSYVRRNAFLAIFTIYKNFDFLIPDAPELIANFLDGEQAMCQKMNLWVN